MEEFIEEINQETIMEEEIFEPYIVDEPIVYNKIYARANKQGIVTYIFSEAFDTPLSTDICIDSTNIERHGAQKYHVVDDDGFYNYSVKNGVLTERDKVVDIEKRAEDDIRSQRAFECFPIINRGKLWYDNLTAEQHEELLLWYKAWLDAPATKEIPKIPDWVNKETK